MARVILCDKCEKPIKNEGEIFKVSFTPVNGIANSTATNELCNKCFDAVLSFAKERPPQAREWGPGD